MPAFDELLFLEQSITEIRQELAKVPASRAAIDRELLAAAASVELHLKDWNICVRNIRHMREVADHVVMEEYIEIRDTRDAEKELLDKARVRLATAENASKRLDGHVTAMEDALAARQGELAEFGQLRHFPMKGTHGAS